MANATTELCFNKTRTLFLQQSAENEHKFTILQAAWERRHVNLYKTVEAPYNCRTSFLRKYQENSYVKF